MTETNPDPKVIEFENKVIATARIMYPGVSCFSPRVLDPIRAQIREADAKMRVPLGTIDELKPAKPVPVPVAVAPKAEPKRKYTKRKK